MSKKEIWVKTFLSDDYEVSNLGRVRSLNRYSRNGKFYKGEAKKLSTNSSGYLTTGIHKRQKAVHQLVYYSFNGGQPSGFDYVIDHIDGDKLNNCLENLQCVSQYQNVMKGALNKSNLPKHVSATPYHYDRNKMVYTYRRCIEGKRINLKQSIHLEKILSFKKEYELKEGE